MGYRVSISDSAERDLDEILSYITDKLANSKAAADFAATLDKKFEVLEEQPFIFELSRNERLAKRGYRRFSVGSYIALYLVVEENREVIIARIFYGRRDYEKYI